MICILPLTRRLNWSCFEDRWRVLGIVFMFHVSVPFIKADHSKTSTTLFSNFHIRFDCLDWIHVSNCGEIRPHIMYDWEHQRGGEWDVALKWSHFLVLVCSDGSRRSGQHSWTPLLLPLPAAADLSTPASASWGNERAGTNPSPSRGCWGSWQGAGL